MKRVALIGSKGYIGKHLEWHLRNMGYAVQGYDFFSSKEEGYVRCDVSNRAEINAIDLDVDYIFMFAGLTGTKLGFEEYKDFMMVNELGLLNLLDAVRKSVYRPHVVFPSTRLVYKGKESALVEDAEKELKTVYAVNKLACEHLLYVYSNVYRIPFTVFRICVPFGNIFGNDYSFGTIGSFIRQAKDNGHITLYGDGRYRRTFTSMGDLCRQIERTLCQNGSTNQVFNVGGKVYSLYEAAIIIAQHYNANIDFIPFPEVDMKIESGSTFFDSKKIESFTGITEYQDIRLLLK